MTQTAPAVQLSLRDIPAPTQALRAALDEVGAQFGLSEEELFDLKVALTEALTNAIKGAAHGHSIDVAVEPREDSIEVEVRNHGGFELHDPVLADIESEGGRGIPLMLALVDEVEFTSTGEGTRVRMRKRLRGALGAQPFPGFR